jgi:hypothetical protein
LYSFRVKGIYLYRSLITFTLALFLAACGGASLYKTDTTGWLNLLAGAAD